MAWKKFLNFPYGILSALSYRCHRKERRKNQRQIEQTRTNMVLSSIKRYFRSISRYWQIPTYQKLSSQLSRFSKCNHTEEMAEYGWGLTTKQTFTPC